MEFNLNNGSYLQLVGGTIFRFCMACTEAFQHSLFYLKLPTKHWTSESILFVGTIRSFVAVKDIIQELLSPHSSPHDKNKTNHPKTTY